MKFYEATTFFAICVLIFTLKPDEITSLQWWIRSLLFYFKLHPTNITIFVKLKTKSFEFDVNVNILFVCCKYMHKVFVCILEVVLLMVVLVDFSLKFESAVLSWFFMCDFYKMKKKITKKSNLNDVYSMSSKYSNLCRLALI